MRESTKRLFLTIVLTLASAQIPLQVQASTSYDSFYLAGVVEFRPSINPNLTQRMLDNLEGYLTVLASEAAKNLDVIVFPESTLNNDEQTTFVPNPLAALVIPCDLNSSDYHSLLVQLSCAAKSLSVYLVINLSEKEWCNKVPQDTRPCAANGLNLYNTNVVFDRTGAIISRYRKVNLYGENKNTTFVPELGWFDTDFGIRFGHFICFDILFYAPAQHMVVYSGITDFIFPSMWYSQLPFLTSLQLQQAWSYANNVNLLAAGASRPRVGSTGTAVYHGRQGIVAAKLNQGIGERKLYVAKVPKYRHLKKRFISATTLSQQSTLALPNIKLKRDYLENYETLPVALNSSTNNTFQREICYANTSFCCKFELKWRPLKLKAAHKRYHYRLGVYNGLRNELAAETNQLKNCALFSCIGEDIMDCGKLLDTNIDVVFENITISATFPKAKRFLLTPNNLNAHIMPLPVNHFQWQIIDQKYVVQVRYELNTTTSNIMAFAIYGNYYDCITDENIKVNNAI